MASGSAILLTKQQYSDLSSIALICPLFPFTG